MCPLLLSAVIKHNANYVRDRPCHCVKLRDTACNSAKTHATAATPHGNSSRARFVRKGAYVHVRRILDAISVSVAIEITAFDYNAYVGYIRARTFSSVDGRPQRPRTCECGLSGIYRQCILLQCRCISSWSILLFCIW